MLADNLSRKLESQLLMKKEAENQQNQSPRKMNFQNVGIKLNPMLKKKTFNVEDETVIRNIHYFDSTEDLELNENLKTLLNNKLTTVSNEYTRKLKHLNELNNTQYKQILKYRVLNDAAFSFKEMNASGMVEKLLIVTDDPKEIWKAFELVSPGFFTKVLQEEYSIGDGFVDKVIDDFNFEIKKVKDDLDERIDEMRKAFSRRSMNMQS